MTLHLRPSSYMRKNSPNISISAWYTSIVPLVEWYAGILLIAAWYASIIQLAVCYAMLMLLGAWHAIIFLSCMIFQYHATGCMICRQIDWLHDMPVSCNWLHDMPANLLAPWYGRFSLLAERYASIFWLNATPASCYKLHDVPAEIRNTQNHQGNYQLCLRRQGLDMTLGEKSLG